MSGNGRCIKCDKQRVIYNGGDNGEYMCPDCSEGWEYPSKGGLEVSEGSAAIRLDTSSKKPKRWSKKPKKSSKKTKRSPEKAAVALVNDGTNMYSLAAAKDRNGSNKKSRRLKNRPYYEVREKPTAKSIVDGTTHLGTDVATRTITRVDDIDVSNYSPCWHKALWYWIGFYETLRGDVEGSDDNNDSDDSDKEEAIMKLMASDSRPLYHEIDAKTIAKLVLKNILVISNDAATRLMVRVGDIDVSDFPRRWHEEVWYWIGRHEAVSSATEDSS